MSSIYAAENTVAREDLAALIARLSDAQLSQPMPAGWTVAAILAHMAFWDQRGTILLRHWKEHGIGPSETDVHIINEAMRRLFLAIPPRAAAELALACAEEVDREIAQLDAAFMAELESPGVTVVLNRSRHRHNHMAEIMQALGLTN